VTSGFGQGARGETLTDAMFYLALQEVATRISHWNTGQHLDSGGCPHVLVKS